MHPVFGSRGKDALSFGLADPVGPGHLHQWHKAEQRHRDFVKSEFFELIEDLRSFTWQAAAKCRRRSKDASRRCAS